MKSNIILGLDIGGTGIKGALVDTNTGKSVSERIRMATPQPATPDAIADSVNQLIADIGYEGNYIGCGFPAIIRNGVAKSAANIDTSWIDVNVEKLLGDKTGKEVYVLNDADAAGVAEMSFGALKDTSGVSLLLTLGTGIGSALFIDGELVPNTEFGHLYLKDQNKIVEKYASNSARKRKDLNYEDWIARLNKLLKHLGNIFSPNMIVLGGGISKKFDSYNQYFKEFDFEISPASLLNHAGLIGAAMYAKQKSSTLISQGS